METNTGQVLHPFGNGGINEISKVFYISINNFLARMELPMKHRTQPLSIIVATS
jgi:hypothetical protein